MKQRRYLKDNEKRFLYKKTEVLQKILKVISLYKTFKSSVSLIIYKIFFFKLLKNSFKTRIKTYCVVSGRSRGVYKKMRVSRICFRELGSKGLFFGLKKASW
jgi:ribosomal protein S14